MPRVVKEPESLQPQQTEAISKLLEQVLTSDGTTIHDTVPPQPQLTRTAHTAHARVDSHLHALHLLALAGAHACAVR